MKVKCINNKFYENYLTIYKIYDIIEKDDMGFFKILDDIGYARWLTCSRFNLLSLSEIRNEKIDKLLE